MIYICALADMA